MTSVRNKVGGVPSLKLSAEMGWDSICRNFEITSAFIVPLF
jgi:hypothetical protein